MGDTDFKIELDRTMLNEVRLCLADIRQGSNTALMRSINRAVNGIKVDAAKEITKRMNLTQARVKKDFVASLASLSYMNAKSTSTGNPIGLINFGARKTQKGVSVMVLKNTGRILLKHAFIATIHEKEHVLWRKYEGPRKPFKPTFPYGKLPTGKGGKLFKYRGPTERLTGPRIQDIYDDPETMNPVIWGANDRMLKEMEHQIEYILSKHRN